MICPKRELCPRQFQDRAPLTGRRENSLTSGKSLCTTIQHLSGSFRRAAIFGANLTNCPRSLLIFSPKGASEASCAKSVLSKVRSITMTPVFVLQHRYGDRRSAALTGTPPRSAAPAPSTSKSAPGRPASRTQISCTITHSAGGGPDERAPYAAPATTPPAPPRQTFSGTGTASPCSAACWPSRSETRTPRILANCYRLSLAFRLAVETESLADPHFR
jgi:hypothetical protein